MNRAIYRYMIFPAALIAVHSWLEAGSLHKVWELRLDPIIKEPAPLGSASPHTVNTIRFSPDEQRLAVVVGMHPIEGSFTSHLLIVDTNEPGTENRQFELARGVFPGEVDYPALLWSPDGGSITVSGVVIPLGGGKECSFDSWDAWLGGYLDSHTLVGRLTPAHVDREHPNSRLVLFGSNCQREDIWSVDGAWLIQDVSPDRGLALVLQTYLGHVGLFDPPKGETLLVDVRRKQVVRRWSATDLMPHQVRFAEGGRTLCAAAGGVRRYAVPAQCVDVDTGKVIADAASVKRAWSIVPASESSRVVIGQYRPEPDDKPTTSVLDCRIVWDFRTNQQIASWRPEVQKWRYPIGSFRHWRSNPSVFAMSPTGKYTAEGGNGVLRLYEIEP